jgi:hypothetical protein
MQVLESGRAPAMVGWLLATVLGAVGYAAAARALSRRRRGWREATVDDVAVLVSDDDSGPAVIGVVTPRIVLPTWVLTLARDRRRLVLAHEREHMLAHDPALLAASVLLVLVAPWNLALWWIARRLRLAVEIDCDRRVLRESRASALEYGRLLVDVGARAGRALPVATAALLERPTALERRITAMRLRRPRHALLRSALLAAIAVAALVAACTAPQPDPTRPAPAGSNPLITAPRTVDELRQQIFARVARVTAGYREPLTAFAIQDATGALIRSEITTPTATGSASMQSPSAPRSLADQVRGIPRDSIMSVEVMKFGGQLNPPTPVTLVLVRLKPGVTLPPTDTTRARR